MKNATKSHYYKLVTSLGSMWPYLEMWSKKHFVFLKPLLQVKQIFVFRHLWNLLIWNSRRISEGNCLLHSVQTSHGFFSNMTNSSGVSKRGSISLYLESCFVAFFLIFFTTFNTLLAFSIISCDSLTMLSKTSMEFLTLSSASLKRLDSLGWALRNIETFSILSLFSLALSGGGRDDGICKKKKRMIFRFLKLGQIFCTTLSKIKKVIPSTFS